MKTERKQLEENTQRQYANERFAELTDLITTKIAKLHIAHAAVQRSKKLLLVSWLLWAGLAIAGHGLADAASLVMFVVFFRDVVFIEPKFTRIDSEIDGIFEALRVLGMLDDKRVDKRNKRRKERYQHPYAGITAKWERIKSKLRNEAYA